MSASTETQGAGPKGNGATGLVARNTFLLVVAQFISAPLSIVINAVMARYLGPGDYGYIYLATTMAQFAFIAVEWGHTGVLPALIARDRALAGGALGSSLAWRIAAIGLAYLVLLGASHLLGYSHAFHVALSLVVLGSAVTSIVGACVDTVRGFERADVPATAMIGQQILLGVFVVPTLLLGGGLSSALLAQAGAYACVLLLVVRAMRGIGIGRLRVSATTLRYLAREGTPFMVLSLVITLQPIVDSLILSKLSTPESMGWHAAARKLVGVLVFPALALINALYPTLSRLHREAPGEYKSMVSGGLRTATVAVIPVALGTYLFADLGIRIFNEETFAPAVNNLQVFSVFVFLLYFSMVLGASLAAAGRQKAWAGVQLACVVVSVAADPLLIPYFEEKVGNGGLGVCISSVMSEALMVGAGLWLTPKGVLNRELGLGVLRGVGAGAAMVGAVLALRPFGPFVTLPASVLAYVGALLLLGGLDAEQIALLRSVMKRKGGR